MSKDKYSMHDELQSMEESSYWWFSARREIIETIFKKYLEDEAGGDFKIIDIGCGMGGEINWLEKYGDVYAIDPEPEAVSFSKARARNPNQVTIGSLPSQINFGKIFDCVIALDVLEHVEDDRSSLEFIFNNLLKDGGFLILTVPAYKFLWSPNDVFNLHKRRYSLSELKNKVEQTGFQILKLSYYNTILFPVALLIKLLSKIIWGLAPRAHFSKSMPIINIFLKKIFSLEKHLITKLNLPFGVSLICVAKKP